MPKNNNIDEITQDATDEIRQKNIKEGLSEIYQDEDGEIINVQKLSIRPKRNWWFWLLMTLLYIVILGVMAYLVFYFINRSTDAEAIELSITSDKQLVTGQEFYYTVKYENLERVGLNDVEIKLDYPENFVYLDAEPAPSVSDNIWTIDKLESHRGGEIMIKGKILAPQDTQHIILGQMVYQPDNFTSDFKKVTSFENVVNDNGLDIEIISPASAMVGEEQRIIIRYSAKDEGYLDNFRLTAHANTKDNIEIMSQQQNEKVTELSDWQWQVDGVDKRENEIKLRFKFIDKVSASHNFRFKFDYRHDLDQELMPAGDDSELIVTDSSGIQVVEPGIVTDDMMKVENLEPVYYTFAEFEQDIEIVKNDLNLNLIVNGQDGGQSVDFGQTLNYSINYTNKGESDMEDIVMMAVLEGSLLDWSTLNDANKGVKKGNTITWNKEQIPQLGSLSPKEDGSIDFNIQVQTAKDARASGSYKGDNEIKSYISFKIMAEEMADNAESNLSNIIVNNVNSDLHLVEQVRYFNEDNIAVGSGPLPPRVGETTDLKVYWDIDNTLHDLNNVQVTAELPSYVVWAGKDQANTGQLRYDQSRHMVIWEADYLPINTSQPQAEFNIQFTPGVSNQNQIMVLLSGTRIVAQDAVTNDEISRINPAKTTKLDDDLMIDNDGVVKE